MSFYANDIVFLQDVEQCLGPFLQRYTKISVGEEEDICKILYLCGLASIKLNDIPVQEATDLQKRCDRVKTLCDMVHYLARHTLSYPHNLVNDDDTSCYYKRLRSLCESREAYKPLISYEEMKVREREVFVVDPMHYVDDLEFLLRARYMISKYHLPTGSNKEKELKAMIDASDAALGLLVSKASEDPSMILSFTPSGDRFADFVSTHSDFLRPQDANSLRAIVRLRSLAKMKTHESIVEYKGDQELLKMVIQICEEAKTVTDVCERIVGNAQRLAQMLLDHTLRSLGEKRCLFPIVDAILCYIDYWSMCFPTSTYDKLRELFSARERYAANKKRANVYCRFKVNLEWIVETLLKDFREDKDLILDLLSVGGWPLHAVMYKREIV